MNTAAWSSIAPYAVFAAAIACFAFRAFYVPNPNRGISMLLIVLANLALLSIPDAGKAGRWGRCR